MKNNILGKLGISRETEQTIHTHTQVSAVDPQTWDFVLTASNSTKKTTTKKQELNGNENTEDVLHVECHIFSFT